MKPTAAILAAIRYIDAHQNEEITCDSLAGQFHYSPFHFNRLFCAVSSLTVAEFVRKRRLEFAAVLLLATEKTVTEICFDCGFGSLQTFHRAFKNAFGHSPKRFRKKGFLPKIKTPDEMIADYFWRVEGGITMKPTFVYRNSFKIVGIEVFTGDGGDVIKKAWKEMLDRYTQVSEVVMPERLYGYEDYARNLDNPRVFHYTAGIEVSDFCNIPKGMVQISVPESEYAVFTVKGNNSNGEIGKTFRYIYDIWFPHSEYEYPDGMFFDFEYYDERWNSEDATNSEVDIYIPVKK
ncbi:MAG: AraC family transcriptional regulator [Oscillospiraceae bacterium]|nr:AraC family transcriptional regulator [Oscillospiraceae bacterium]